MKEKILAAIKAKYPSINLSKKRLEAISVKIESKVIDDESKIDAALDTYNDFNPLADIAKADDAQRNLEAKLKAAGQPIKKDEAPKDDEPADDTPAWAKTLIESNKKLSDKVGQLESEKTQTTIKSVLGEKLKDVPASFGWQNWKLPETNEEIDAFVEKVNTDYKLHHQSYVDQGFASVPKPGGGSPAGGGGKHEVGAELKAYYEKKNVEQKQQQPASNSMIITSTK